MNGIAQEFEEAFIRLQKPVEEVWQLVDKCASSLAASVEELETNDPAKAMERARNVHATALKLCNALQSFVASWKLKTDGFAEKTAKLELDIDRIARDGAITRLPDGLLVDILDRAAVVDSLGYPIFSFKASVRLSHVCKRFRRTLLSSSKYWAFRELTPTLPPSIIQSIVEQCVDESFEANVDLNRKVGPTSDSIKAIMDVGSRLKSLKLLNWRSDVPPLTFPGDYHLPSLRTLECDFLPHPSLSRNVVTCYLRMETASLKHLLEFLSSATKLEALRLELVHGFSDQNITDSLEPISLPSLTALSFRADHTESVQAYNHFVEKIVPFTVSSLHLTYTRIDLDLVMKLIHAKTSIRYLHLDLWRVPSVPPYIEALGLSGGVAETIDMWVATPSLFPERNLRLLKIFDRNAPSIDILRLRDHLVTSGCDQVRFQFFGCAEMEDGTYDLHNVHKAIRH